jgi:hypothetical protein
MGIPCSTHGSEEYCIQSFGRKSERQRSLGRPVYTWEGNIKMDIKSAGWETSGWIHLAQDGNQWQAFSNTIIYPLFHKMLVIS